MSRAKHTAPTQDFHPDLIPPDCCTVPLANGGYAIVDEEDLCRVDEYKWYKHYSKDGRVCYAVTAIREGGRRRIVSMHRLLFGLTTEDRIKVDHENHNGLDNRRSCNIRLATHTQNMANRLNNKTGKSKYRGAYFRQKLNKWLSLITIDMCGRRRSISFGTFDVEEEAAYAFSVAATLLRDPDFLLLDPIPDDKLPSLDRQEEIKICVVSKVKAVLSGKKGTAGATSTFRGVSYLSDVEQWRAIIRLGARPVWLGHFRSEMEAAYAYDHAIFLAKLTRRRTNKVGESNLESLDRAREIRTEVSSRLEMFSTGQKIRNGTTSCYRGACFVKDESRWHSSISLNKKNIMLSRFDSEIEAAVAYNVAVSILGNSRHRPNPIPPEEMPDPEVIESIRLKVIARLAQYHRDHATS